MKNRLILLKFTSVLFLTMFFLSNLNAENQTSEMVVSNFALPHLKNGKVIMKRFNGHSSYCYYYVTLDKGEIQLNGDIDAINALVCNEVSSREEAIVFLKKDLSRLILMGFKSINDIVEKNTDLIDVRTSAGVRYERYLNKENQTKDEFFKMIAETGGENQIKLNEEDNTWKMKCYVYNSRLSMELWEASGTIYPLRLLKFSKEKIVMPEEWMFRPFLVN